MNHPTTYPSSYKLVGHDGEQIETVVVSKRDYEQLRFERTALVRVAIALAICLLVTSGAIWWTRSKPQILIVPTSSPK